MLSLSNQLTVPQIFFNEEHVGGASDLLYLLSTWDDMTEASESASIDSYSPSIAKQNRKWWGNHNKKKKRASVSMDDTLTGSSMPFGAPSLSTLVPPPPTTALEFYHREIASKPDPSDERLKLVSPEEVQKRANEISEGQIPSDICAFGCFLLPDGQAVSVRELISDLMQVLPRHEKLPYLAKYYVNCFPGDAGVDALLEHYKPHLQTREDAVAFGLALQQYGVIHHVCDEHQFSDTGALFFRLQPFHEPNILNSFQKSHRCGIPEKSAYGKNSKVDVGASFQKNETTSVSSRLDPMILIKKLRSMLQTIQTKYTNSQGMDYIAARNSQEFALLEEAACEIQCISMKDMDDTTKTAFGLNLYNVMIQHAFIKVGIAKTGSQRGAFFSGVSYNVGGHVLSLDDVEHGILRANTRHPYALKPPLQDKERRELAVSGFDPRIHFALSCGANSCPPVNQYTPEALEEELRIAAMSFCEHDSNVLINEEKMELHLTKLFHWYRLDFLRRCPPSMSSLPPKQQLPHIVLNYLWGEKKDKLQRMVDKTIAGDRRQAIKVKYLPYDWGTNASNSIAFHSRILTKTQKSLKAALQRYATNEIVSAPRSVLTKMASERVMRSLQATSSRLQRHQKLNEAKHEVVARVDVGDEALEVMPIDHSAIHPAAILSVRDRQKPQQCHQEKVQQEGVQDRSHSGPRCAYLTLLVVFVGVINWIRGMTGQMDEPMCPCYTTSAELHQCPATPFQ